MLRCQFHCITKCLCLQISEHCQRCKKQLTQTFSEIGNSAVSGSTAFSFWPSGRGLSETTAHMTNSSRSSKTVQFPPVLHAREVGWRQNVRHSKPRLAGSPCASSELLRKKVSSILTKNEGDLCRPEAGSFSFHQPWISSSALYERRFSLIRIRLRTMQFLNQNTKNCHSYSEYLQIFGGWIRKFSDSCRKAESIYFHFFQLRFVHWSLLWPFLEFISKAKENEPIDQFFQLFSSF